MIQGLGMDSRGWALQRGSFGRRHCCIAVDNRGTGAVRRTRGPYDLLRMAEDAVAVLDAEGIERAHIVGASMGGIIAQIIGVLHRERVMSLTLACTACHHHEWRRELLEEWADVVGERGMRAMAEEDGMRWLIGPRLQRRFGVWINVLARVLMQTKPEPFVAQVRAILDASDELRNELDTITVPTLVITGSQDTLTPVGDAEELAELIHDVAPLRAQRRRARPDGRDAERVQRRGVAVPRRGRRRRRTPSRPPKPPTRRASAPATGAVRRRVRAEPGGARATT